MSEDYQAPSGAGRPITPPPELVRQWKDQWLHGAAQEVDIQAWIATQAARWGADRELEACVEWLSTAMYGDTFGSYSTQDVAVDLRAARRPKPLSLKEQALAVLDDASDRLDAAHENVLRRALEQLDG